MIILKNLIIEISWNSLVTSLNSIILIINIVMYIWFKKWNKIFMNWSLINLIIIILIWYLDIFEESERGNHTNLVKKNLLIGFILFIISEILLFSTLFGIYFYDILNPSIFLSSSWNHFVNNSLLTYKYNGIPLLNVIILFMSGITITIALSLKTSLSSYLSRDPTPIKNSVISKTLKVIKRNTNYFYLSINLKLILLYITCILALIFVFIQFKEYSNSKFTISDSIYSNIFYSLTSLHGILMIIGLVIIIIACFRLYLYIFVYLNILCGSINLLFLDICFIFIFFFLYCYSS